MGIPVVLFLSLALQQQSPDSAVLAAREAIRPLTDSIALRDAGFFPIGFGAGTRDLTPFQGQHWLSIGRFGNNQPVNIAKPTFAIYLPVGDSLIPVGVAHTRRIPIDAPAPTDLTELGGKPVEWHTHVVCRAIPGEGQVITDGVEDCTSRGGTLPPNRITMAHVWTVPNPDGPYAHDNVALPFIATGITPPTRVTADDRALAVALGETYGAKIFVAHRIERDVKKAGTPNQLAEKRAAMREIVARLRAADRARDARRFAAEKKQLMDAWRALADEYRAVAPTPEVKARFDAEMEQALHPPHHHRG
jgi:hypothetical protein